MKMVKRTFDRVVEFDERSRAHPIRALVVPQKPRSYHWRLPVHLNQGSEGACVGFAFAHEGASEPAMVKGVTNKVARGIYHRAQQLDNYPDDQGGSSVLAGAKACVEKGWFAGYKWAFGMDDLLLALSYAGPVVLGINWYEGMERPDRSGLVRVTGKLRGGHCIEVNENIMETERVRLPNSWGTSWGKRGDCFLGFKDLERLLHEQGEACVPIGRREG